MIKCEMCNKEIDESHFIKHIDSHQLTEKDKCIIFEKCINENHYKKIYKYEKMYLEVLFLLNEKMTFKQFNKNNRYIRSFNSYIKIVESFKLIDIKDIYNFFKCYIQFRSKHPRENFSFNCAMAYCGNDEEMAKIFYKKIILPKNPFYKHDGTLSPYSRTFVGYKNLNDEEITKEIRMKCFCKDRPEFEKFKKNNSVTLEY